jgi:hypothetical protein
MIEEMGLVAAGSLILLLGIYLLYRRFRSAPPRSQAAENQKFVERLLKADEAAASTATETTFRNMFFTTADRGEGLIEHYMAKHACGRAEAMQRAIREREAEDKRYD